MRTKEKELKILNYISDFTEKMGYPPTVREIAEGFAIKSTSTVQYYLEKLRKNGDIAQSNCKSRAVVPSKNTKQQMVSAPLVGTISAGQGILALENIEDTYLLPQNLFSANNVFLLRVQGDSMIEAGICENDIVVVNKQETAANGDIVIVLWEETATVKRFVSCKNGKMVLHPENSTMQDIVLNKQQNPQILGKVVGCIKRF